MKHLGKDHLFPLITAGIDFLDIIPRYNAVVDKIVALEQRLKLLDAGLDLSNMWTCSTSNGKLIFDITMHCKTALLRSELKLIFCEVVR